MDLRKRKLHNQEFLIHTIQGTYVKTYRKMSVGAT
jgi:hypothetical protein